ncbi:PH domain-containing protein [Flavobacterium sp. IMCC34852]|uniref:PH domain-containing protein n=1 Tax=Flavobacterium rivulicola TaxID=2732161 RepID=A0A7Y3R897_9FLAO|nr:PH domain-containing protein [Flavobacterium sp. IMCC34852]NNT71739.1 PH domain-containing protein [Flavobacterium sp. IMCC34852]
MENFTNETIDTKALPRFETVQLSPIDSKYWQVILISIFSFFFLGLAIMVILFFLVDEVVEQKPLIFSAYTAVFAIALLLSRISFKKKAYAFRNHDVIFRSGIIATNTMVIPYNRVQHVALHEGFIARFFGLAKVEIFTAGGISSDLEIPGIAKEEAENIKQLLMGKIQKQL